MPRKLCSNTAATLAEAVLREQSKVSSQYGYCVPKDIYHLDRFMHAKLEWLRAAGGTVRERLLHEAGPPRSPVSGSLDLPVAPPPSPAFKGTRDHSFAIATGVCAPMRRHALETPFSCDVGEGSPRSDTEQTTTRGINSAKREKKGRKRRRAREKKAETL